MLDFSQVPRSMYVKKFRDDVPHRLAVDIAKVIQQATTQAFIGGTDLIPGAKRDKYPIDRRALVETGFAALASRHKGLGVTAEERTNSAGSASHVELAVGRVVIIPAAVRTSTDLVRKAKYRTSLAQSPQLALEGLGIDVPDPSDALLAVALYGPRNIYPLNAIAAKPTFVIVRFPASDWSCYAEGRIDLLLHLEFAERGENPPNNVALWPEEGAI